MKLFKKIIASVIAVTLTCGTCLACGQDDGNIQPERGDDGTSGLLYGEIGNDAYEVIGYIGKDKNVVVPAKHNGLPVISISSDAFYYSENVEKITLPEGLTKIEAGALTKRSSGDDSRFIDFNVPSTVIDFENYGLSISDIPSEKITDGGFYVDNCLVCMDYRTENFQIKPGTRIVADSALHYQAPIAIPDSVEYLGDTPSGIWPVPLSSIGKGLKRIGSGYASTDFDINKVDIVDNVILRMPYVTFNYNYKISKDIRVVSDGFINGYEILCDVDKANPNYYSENNYVIEKATKRIVGGNASSPLPQSAKIIGAGVRLPNVDGQITIPDNIEVIERGVGNTVPVIEKLTFGGNLKSLYAGIISVNEINYTGTVEQFCKIQTTGLYDSPHLNNAFTYTTTLKIDGRTVTDLVVPDGIERISALCGNGAVTSLTLPDSVKSIGSFGIGENVETITCGGGLQYIGRQRDELGSAQNIDMNYNGNIDELCSRRIVQCSEIGSKSYIYYDLYMNGKRVADLTIPNSVTEINEGAFFGTRLDSVTIPSSVTYIGKNAFSMSGLSSARFQTPSGWTFALDSEPVRKNLSDATEAANFLALYEVKQNESGLGFSFYNCPALTRN